MSGQQLNSQSTQTTRTALNMCGVEDWCFHSVRCKGYDQLKNYGNVQTSVQWY